MTHPEVFKPSHYLSAGEVPLFNAGAPHQRIRSHNYLHRGVKVGYRYLRIMLRFGKWDYLSTCPPVLGSPLLPGFAISSPSSLPELEPALQQTLAEPELESTQSPT